jgi:SsrA-binding protein
VEIKDRKIKTISRNKKLRHDFEILQTIEAGIALLGTEVKSLREGRCTLQDAYAYFPNKDDDELYLINLHIPPYKQGNINNHDPERKRKLLVNQREAVKLRTAIQEKGLTLMPYSLYFSGRYIKVELCVVRAKKKYDKRESIKERDTERNIQRNYRYR